MKKLRLNKIFHWLYAFLMFLPVITIFGYILSVFGTGNFDYNHIYDILGEFGSVFAYPPVDDVFAWIANFLGEDGSFGLYYLFSYWICISIIWLCFDVLIFIINVAHHWLDEGADKLC